MSTVADCRSSLEHHEQVSEAVLSFSHSRKSDFIEYFLPVVFDPKVNARFQEKKGQWGLSSTSLEKREIGWVSLDSMLAELPKCCEKYNGKDGECQVDGKSLRNTVTRTMCLALKQGALQKASQRLHEKKGPVVRSH